MYYPYQHPSNSISKSLTEHKNSGRRWVEKARLVDFRGTVQDIEFAPNHLGLKLAACSADGIVRIYEAMDIVNLSNWTLMEEFEVSGMGNTTTTTTSTITSSTSSSAISNAATFQQPNFSLQPSTALKDHSDAHYCLSWCPSRFGPQMLTVGCGPFHSARIFRMDMHNKWVGMETLPHIDVVTDIAWAPNVGRSYQLIATSSKDGHVRIFKLSDESPNKSQQSTYATAVASSLTKKRFKVELIGDFPDHHSEVWRVEWNITGTVLSSSGDDGKVRLWKPTYLGEWKCLAIVAAESSGASSQLMNSHSSSLEQSQNIASNNALKSNQSSILNLAQGANTSGGHSKGSSFTGTSVFGTTASSSTSQQHQQQQQPSTSFTSTTTSTSTQPQQGFMSSSNVSSSLFSPVSTDMSSAALMGSSPGTSHQKYHHGYGYGFSGGD